MEKKKVRTCLHVTLSSVLYASFSLYIQTNAQSMEMIHYDVLCNASSANFELTIYVIFIFTTAVHFVGES